MKKTVFFLVFAAMFLMWSNVMAQSVLITGYGPKQYAVVGEIEVQAKKFVDSLAGKKFSHMVVEGMADKSGDKAGNEEYGSKRARDMQAYLAIRFPDAKIIARSLGDEENARGVRITAMEYVQPLSVLSPVSAQAPKTEVEPIFLLYNMQVFGSVILVLAFAALIINVYRSKKTKSKTQVPADKPAFEEAKIEGYFVKILCVPAEKRWYSPFFNAQGNRIYEESKTKIIGSVSRCLKSPKFSQQLAKLLDSGEIKKL